MNVAVSCPTDISIASIIYAQKEGWRLLDLLTFLGEIVHNHPCKSYDHDHQWADLVMT